MDLLYFVILISALIFVHELGHYAWAKIFGVKVITFSLGFGPKILRLRGKETEYCIGLIPLGGFVKMLEESKAEPVLPEDRKRTFESQALWKRVVIVFAGPIMNLIFPVVLYFSVFVGERNFLPPTIGVVLPGHAADGKLLAGDRILAVDGEEIGTYAELSRAVQKSPGRELNLKVFRNAGYDPIMDFAPVIVAVVTPNMLFVHPAVAAHTLAELIALAKTKPLSYASPGAGTTPHLTAELLLKIMGGADITHIPYTSGALAVNAVVGGQVPVGSLAISTVVPFVKAGRLRGIAITSAQRAPALPEVPTVAESGYPGYEDYTWVAFFAPRGTPRGIVEKLNAGITKVLQAPMVKERLGAIGFDHNPNTPAQFADYLKGEVVKWAKVVKDSGARAD